MRRSSRRCDFALDGWCELFGPARKATVEFAPDGVMTLRHTRELLLSGLQASLFLGLQCVGLRLYSLLLFGLKVFLLDPPPGLSGFLAGTTECP